VTFTEHWFSAEQADHISNLALGVKHLGAVVEIGCWEGFSTHYIAKKIFPDDIYCIDTWRGNETESLVTNIEHGSVTAAKERDVFKTFCDNMDTLTKGNYIVMRQDWRSVVLYDPTVLAFLHIDAEHDYQSVFDCITRFYPFIVKGGIMCGDDFRTADIGRADLHGGVERAVREYFEPLGITVHTDYNAWWIYKP
jgi:predicted O-methyltransferase YrrM